STDGAAAGLGDKDLATDRTGIEEVVEIADAGGAVRVGGAEGQGRGGGGGGGGRGGGHQPVSALGGGRGDTAGVSAGDDLVAVDRIDREVALLDAAGIVGRSGRPLGIIGGLDQPGRPRNERAAVDAHLEKVGEVAAEIAAAVTAEAGEDVLVDDPSALLVGL